MPRVAHLTSVHTSDDTRIFHKECRTLALAGHDVVLIAPHYQEQTVDGVRIRAVPKPKNRLARITQTIWHVYRAAIEENADLYHFHDPELIPAGWLLSRRGKPVIYDVHEDYVTSLRQKKYLPRPLRLALATCWGKAETQFTKPFRLVLSEKYYSDRFPCGIPVLNFPLQEHFIEPTRGDDQRLCPPVADADVGAQPAAPVRMGRLRPADRLLYTGVVSEDRGALLHSQLVTMVTGVEVHIVGRCSTDLADKMRKKAGDHRDRLHIEGEGQHVPYGRILETYAQGHWLAGLAVFPPTPHYVQKELTKFFEYMGAGIPIICSDFPTWRSLMKRTGAGLCVDPASPHAAADAVRFLLEHPAEARNMSENGRRAFEKDYNWEGEAKKLLELYKELAG